MGKPEEKRQVGIGGRRWKDNIKMNLNELRYEGVD
jgi:hypothetical protein